MEHSVNKSKDNKVRFIAVVVFFAIAIAGFFFFKSESDNLNKQFVKCLSNNNIYNYIVNRYTYDSTGGEYSVDGIYVRTVSKGVAWPNSLVETCTVTIWEDGECYDYDFTFDGGIEKNVCKTILVNIFNVGLENNVDIIARFDDNAHYKGGYMFKTYVYTSDKCEVVTKGELSEETHIYTTTDKFWYNIRSVECGVLYSYAK